MTFNPSFTQVLAISVLILGVLVPIGVFAAPVFETGTVLVGPGFHFAPEQSWSNTDNSGNGQITEVDVLVYDGGAKQEVYVSFVLFTNPTVYLAYTDTLQLNANTGSPYFINFQTNSTQTVALSEWTGQSICNQGSQPKVAVTSSHVFVSWIDREDTEGDVTVFTNCDGTVESERIATIAIEKSKFSLLNSAAFFVNATSRPAYFDTGADIAASYSLTADGSNAYIAWETGDINDPTVNFVRFDGAGYVASPDDSDFVNAQVLGSSTSQNPDVIVDASSDIHVAWQDGDGVDTNIKLVTSTDSGVTFGTVDDISETNSVASTNAKLAEAGGTVYVSWLEGADFDQVFVASSADSYTSSVAVSTNEGISSGHRIIAVGTNVYTVWQDTIDGATAESHDILFSSSTNSGVDFGTPINLSQSSGDSILPKISASSTNVNVVWRDNTFADDSINSIDGEVWFKSSSDSGATFSGLQVISEGTTDSAESDSGQVSPVPIPNISSTDTIVVAGWSPNPIDPIITSPTVLGKWDGALKTAIPSIIDISFNSTEYLSPRNATLTVLDATEATSGSVKVDVLFPQSGTREDVILFEGPSGVFTKSFELYNGTTDLDLGDIFTANYTAASGSNIKTEAKMQETRILDFITTGVLLHDLGNIVGITLTDADSAGAETVKIKIKSDVDNQGISIILDETGVGTGVFTATTSVIFMDGAFTPTVNSDAITITYDDDANFGNPGIDTITRKISTETDPAGFNIVLTETGLATDIYTYQISICDESTLPHLAVCNSPSIAGKAGDFIKLSLEGGSMITNGMVFPDKIVDRGAIQVSCTNTNCGQVRAIYNDLEVSFNVGMTAAGGGGGGGVSRAGLVVNALAGISLHPGGGGTDGAAPVSSLSTLITNDNFDAPDEIVKIVENSDSTTVLAPIPTSTFADFDMPLTINDNGYPLGDYSNTIQTFSTDIGEPMTITSLYYEQTALQHVSMYMNLRDDTTGDLSKSDTQILYNKDKPLQVIDPNGFFEKVSVNVFNDEDEESYKKFAEFEIIFAKPMETSDIVFRSWDDRLRSMDTIIYDAIEIIDPQTIVQTIDPEPVEDIIEPVAEVQKVPEGMKNISEWWSQGEVDDTKFKEVIQFLIQEEIIDVPTELNVSVSKDDELAEEESDVYEEPTTQIPEWIKNNAEWWYLGVISEDDFLKSVEYLVKNEIIQI